MIIAYDGDAFTENLLTRLKEVPLTRTEIASFRSFVNDTGEFTAPYCADWLEVMNSRNPGEAAA